MARIITFVVSDLMSPKSTGNAPRNPGHSSDWTSPKLNGRSLIAVVGCERIDIALILHG
jgi:hypothetical protein